MNRETFKSTEQTHLQVYHLTPRKAFLRPRDLEQYPSSGFESTDPLETDYRVRRSCLNRKQMHFLAEEVTASPQVVGFFRISHWEEERITAKVLCQTGPGEGSCHCQGRWGSSMGTGIGAKPQLLQELPESKYQGFCPVGAES